LKGGGASQEENGDALEELNGSSTGRPSSSLKQIHPSGRSGEGRRRRKRSPIGGETGAGRAGPVRPHRNVALNAYRRANVDYTDLMSGACKNRRRVRAARPKISRLKKRALQGKWLLDRGKKPGIGAISIDPSRFLPGRPSTRK